jgi:hypothetical protein
VAVLFILPLGVLAPAAQTQDQKRMVRAVDRTLREGLHAQLPPHLSTLLGMSEEKESPVMQSLVRSEKVVRGFDVSVANKNDVVLFVVNETARDQILYLTSREGALRRVVSVKRGVGGVLPVNGEDRKEFEKEKRFWLDRLAPAGASK